LFVVWRIVSLGRAWKGGLPLGFSITQFRDIVGSVAAASMDCVGGWRSGLYLI
jgi:hypothetical protein